ncbi:MAG: PAS domain S-box protein [Deltaproteobacteria bacterium]|nr:PAS domain S-box protein [Deltaproteobacteria bacterium]
MDDGVPLYNSSIVKTYLEYLSKVHPALDGDLLLSHAGMSRHEVEDPGHWFTQRQIDRFHDILQEMTADPHISREAGRYAAFSRASGVVKQYALGFLSPAAAYWLTERLVPYISRGHLFKIRRLSANRVMITVTQKQGVSENPHQCENRIGHFEALAYVFTKRFARVDHPECVHRGGDVCRYEVAWENTPSMAWKGIRNWTAVSSALLSLGLLFLLPFFLWLPLFLFLGLVSSSLALVAEHLENRELGETVRVQGNTARERLDEIHRRYNNALLIQEIGETTSAILDTSRLIEAVLQVMARRLDFDRGLVLLPDPEGRHLRYRAGYGFGREQEALLRSRGFHLDRADSRGVFVLAFRERRPFLVENLADIEKDISEESLDLAREMGVKSMICVPIVYEGHSLGIIAVDNLRTRRSLTQSDMSLLLGVASHMAANMAKTTAFQRLGESERKYRELVENANSIIMRRDISGKIAFFNEYAQRFFGYSEEEIIGREVVGTIVPETDSSGRDLRGLIQDIGLHAGRYTVNENENMKRNGERVWIAWTNKAVRDEEGNIREILCIGNDVTRLKQAEQEKRALEARLQRAQKMEAIGTLAGGVAHDLNNILSGLVSYPELLLMDIPGDSPLRRPILTIKRAGERAAAIVQDLLTLARRGIPVTEVVSLNGIVDEYLKSPEYQSLRLYSTTFEVDLDLQENLLNVLGSPVHLSKTLGNLVSNAAEAMPDGGRIRIRTENRYVDRPVRGYDDVEEGDYAILTVSDEGIGIAPEDLERIFEPFYTKKVMGRSGTGLGMAVVWGTVKDHRGYIDVQSAEGKGTTFSLYFPVTREARRDETGPVGVEAIMGRGESILIVDDVEEQREIASGMLRRLGYSVTALGSGEEAVDYMQGHSADLVLLDMIMDPGMDGLETYSRILEFHPGQRAIIVSGFSETQRVREAQRLGARAYVRKPYLIDRIGAEVKSALKK